jgi:hypothetical protein
LKSGSQRPDCVSRMQTAAQHAALPACLVVREVHYSVRTPGFRTRAVTLVTTLLHQDRYPVGALSELYRGGWQVETNLRYLKQTLGLAVPHSQTVTGVEKEILVFGIVYNLVQSRRTMAAAAQDVSRAQISFVDAWRQLRWVVRSTRRGRTARNEVIRCGITAVQRARDRKVLAGLAGWRGGRGAPCGRGGRRHRMERRRLAG